MRRSFPWGVLLSCGAAAILGVIGVVLAGRLSPPPSGYDSPLFPAVDRGIEGLNGLSLVMLAAAGFVPAAFRKAPPVLIGMATMALFPVMSLAEMIADPTSHNLWPFEWFLYGVETLPGLVGAFLGQRFGRTSDSSSDQTGTPQSR